MPKPLDLPFDPIDRAGQIWERTFGPASAMRVATSVMRVQQILLSHYDEILRPYGLTFARYEALVLLCFSRTGALPLKVVGRRLMVHPTSVTNTVDRLAHDGFVQRKQNPRDGRGVLAEVTDRGRDVVEQATRDLTASDFGLQELSEQDREAVFAALRTVRHQAGDFRTDDAGANGAPPAADASPVHDDSVHGAAAATGSSVDEAAGGSVDRAGPDSVAVSSDAAGGGE